MIPWVEEILGGARHFLYCPTKLLIGPFCICQVSTLPHLPRASPTRNPTHYLCSRFINFLFMLPFTTLFTSKMNNSTSTLKHHCVTSLKTLTPHITCLAVHRNLLYAASLNLINVFDTLSHYSHIDAFNESPTSGFVKSIAFSASRIFTAHQDCKIRVWLITPAKRHRLLSSLPTVTDRLRRGIVPRNYVSVRRHKTRLWIQHCDTVSGLSVNETERLMYSVSWDKSIKIWDLLSNRCLESVKAHDDAINAVTVSNDGTVYTASADGSIKVWKKDEKLKQHALVSTMGKQKSTVNALALEDGGAALFSGACDGAICRWEWGENGVVKMDLLRGHGGAILCLVHVASFLASASADLTVRIWQRRGYSGYCCRAVLEGHEKPVKSLVAFAGSEEDSNGVVTLFSGSLDGEIKVWEVFGLV